MINKIKKYYNYIERFAKSPHKTKNIVDLISEIKEKGIVTGIRSTLHIKSGKYNPDTSFNEFKSHKKLAKEYDKTLKVTLPYTKTPLVSIIIPVYNQLDFTFNCVMSILENNELKDYEIIIADDNSTDDYSTWAAHFEHIIHIKNALNLGFLKNCNNAAAHARGKYLVFLNNDTQVCENWLQDLVNVFKNDPRAGIAGSKLVYPNGQLQEAGGIIWQDGSAINFGNRDNPANPEYNYLKEVDYISGASIMIDKRIWDEVGGFDEAFSPAYNEDSDLCFQVRAVGYKVIYQPFSEVIHFEGISHGTDVRKGVKQYQVLNRQKFAEKWQKELVLKSKKGKNLFFERDRSTGYKHVLIIDHNVPTVDKDAGSRTINNFVDTLLSMNCKVKFLVPNMYPPESYMRLLQQKGVEVLHGDKFVYWNHEWENYFKANMNNFDAIILSRSSICTPHLKYLINHHYKGKTIYYGHDLGFLRTEEEARLKGDKALIKVAKKIKADEDFMYNNASNSIVISYDELNFLKGYISKPLHYIAPYFFDVQKKVNSFNQRSGILFVGGFHHPPNQDAMKWFLNNAYKNIESENIKLTIAGSEMPDFMYEYKRQFPSLEILPDVSTDKLEELYNATRIAIVPLTLGAGVKGKVIEAMAKGVPMVGTDKAFEGLYKDESFLYTPVNDADEFARQVVILYSDKQKWDTLSEFGLNYVSQYFNKEKMKEVFSNII